MAKQTVNIGTNQDDGTGDVLRDAFKKINENFEEIYTCLLYTSPSPRDRTRSRMPSYA